MRASLPKSLAERRHSPRRRSRPAAAPVKAPAEQRRGGCPDPDVERARDAGGPIDQASYACGCGYVFLAQVSTTVTCPHCQAAQAW
jgi:hypothetical protein